MAKAVPAAGRCGPEDCADSASGNAGIDRARTARAHSLDHGRSPRRTIRRRASPPTELNCDWKAAPWAGIDPPPPTALSILLATRAGCQPIRGLHAGTPKLAACCEIPPGVDYFGCSGAQVLDPREEYGKRLAIHVAAVAQKQRQHIRLGNAKLAVVAAAIVLLGLVFARHVSAYWLILPAGIYRSPRDLPRIRHSRPDPRTKGSRLLPLGIRADGRPLGRHGRDRRTLPRSQACLRGRSRSFRARLPLRAAFNIPNADGRKPPGRVAAFAFARSKRSSIGKVWSPSSARNWICARIWRSRAKTCAARLNPESLT